MAVYKVYHGSREGKGNSGAKSAGLGDWFATDNKKYAERYGPVKKCTITLNNPYKMDFMEFRSLDRGPLASFRRSKEFRKELEKKGYDGIIVTHHDGIKEYILFLE